MNIKQSLINIHNARNTQAELEVALAAALIDPRIIAAQAALEAAMQEAGVADLQEQVSSAKKLTAHLEAEAKAEFANYAKTASPEELAPYKKHIFVKGTSKWVIDDEEQARDWAIKNLPVALSVNASMLGKAVRLLPVEKQAELPFTVDNSSVALASDLSGIEVE